MNDELIDIENVSQKERDALAEGIENGIYNPYLVYSYDQWNQAKNDIRADPNLFAKKIGANELSFRDIEALDKIYKDFYNYHHKNAIKAPLDDPDYLLDIAYNLHRYMGPMPVEYYAIRSKYKQNLKKFNNKYGIPYWKRWYTRLNKVADRAVNEGWEIVKENTNYGYVGKYEHGEFGMKDAPKLPGHNIIKKIGEKAALVATVGDITTNAIKNAKAGVGVLNSIGNTIRNVGKHFLKYRPMWWGKKRADIREAKREGRDITDLKAKYGVIDAAAYIGAHAQDYYKPPAEAYLSGVLTKDPFSMDKKESNANKKETKSQNTKQKTFIDIGSSNYGAGGGGRRFWYPSAKNKYGSRKYHPVRGYYSRYRWRRRYFKKGARYHKKYKNYGRYFRFYK